MQLGTQLLVAAGLIVAMTLIHGIGLVGITRLLNLEQDALARRRVGLGAFALMVSMALCLFFIHVIEIALFALFYLWVGAITQTGEALVFSTSVYATLGHTIDDFPDQWRLIGAIEGVIGFVLLGWSTAVFVTDMNALLRKR